MIVQCASTVCNFEVVKHNSRFLLREMEKRQLNKNPLLSHLKTKIELHRCKKHHRIVRYVHNMKTGVTTEGTQLGYIDTNGNYYDIGRTMKGSVTDTFFNLTPDGYL